jgi:hypothetical protein
MDDAAHPERLAKPMLPRYRDLAKIYPIKYVVSDLGRDEEIPSLTVD